jgi:uncharacterized protein YbbK (DUF523 family)
MKPIPLIAISSCILGNRVRYDAELKYFPELCEQLQQHFKLLAVCPEVEIGLSVPRPPLQLSGDAQHPRMTGRDDPRIDVSDAMYAFCSERPAQLQAICGYVFKSRSPSCGLRQIPVFRDGSLIEDHHRGLFAEAMMERYPELPVAEETDLQNERQLQHFINRALNYDRRRPMIRT